MPQVLFKGSSTSVSSDRITPVRIGGFKLGSRYHRMGMTADLVSNIVRTIRFSGKVQSESEVLGAVKMALLLSGHVVSTEELQAYMSNEVGLQGAISNIVSVEPIYMRIVTDYVPSIEVRGLYVPDVRVKGVLP